MACSRKTRSNFSITVLLRKNHNCVNGAGVIDEGPANGWAENNPVLYQIVIQRSETTDTELKLRLGSLNLGTMSGRAGDAVETSNRRKVDVSCIKEVRWRGTSATLITGKNSEYKKYWVGNNLGLGGVGILVVGSGLVRSLM